jgi:chemotaxis protein methyltransferase CheR
MADGQSPENNMKQGLYSSYAFTDDDFEYIRSLIGEYSGIHLTQAKRELVYARLAKRLRDLGLTDFKQYCDLLRAGKQDEMVACVNAITTNVTSFFREEHHFSFLAETVVPWLLARHAGPGPGRLRIWSAGCSSGEEPYSIEMTLRDFPELDRWDVKILATDLDSNVLERARQGVYRMDQLEKVTEAKRKRWFLRGDDNNLGQVKIRPGLKSRIYFRQLNLMAPWPMQGQFQVIFCRNVVIYFDKARQKELFQRFADILIPEGYLFIGHSENLFGVSDRFRSIGRTIYRKVD